MKLKIYLILICGVLFAAFTAVRSNSGMPESTTWEAMNLKGKIKAMCQCDFNATAHGDVVSKLSETPVAIDSTWFDGKGNRLKEDKFNSAGKLMAENNSVFDSNENLLETSAKIKNRLEHKDSYKYDNNNNVTEAKHYRGDTLFTSDAFKYDNSGNIIEKDMDVFYPVKKSEKHYFEYDANGNKVKENVFVIGSSVYTAHTWKYDGTHHITEADDFNSKGALTAKRLMKYDSRGSQAEIAEYNADGSLGSKKTFTYDWHENKTEEDWYNGDGSRTRYYTFKYDDKGNQTEYKQFNVYKDDTQMEVGDTYLFEYDKKDNWVKKTDLKIDGTIIVTEREIMYY